MYGVKTSPGSCPWHCPAPWQRRQCRAADAHPQLQPALWQGSAAQLAQLIYTVFLVHTRFKSFLEQVKKLETIKF